MYSASVVERTTLFWSLDIQLTDVPPKVKIYPVVLFLVSINVNIPRIGCEQHSFLYIIFINVNPPLSDS